MGDAFLFAAIVMIGMVLAAIGLILLILGLILLICFLIRYDNGQMRSKRLFALPVTLLSVGVLLFVPLVIFYIVCHWSQLFHF